MAHRPDSLVIRDRVEYRTAIKKDMFIAALKRLHNVRVACEVLQIGRRTAYDWKDSDPDFSERWDEAIEFSKEALESATYLKAIEGKTPAAITASIFLLKGMYPSKYADRVDMTQKVSFTIDWSKVDDNTLTKFNAGELTLLDVYNSTIQQKSTERDTSETGRSEGSSTERTTEAPTDD